MKKIIYSVIILAVLVLASTTSVSAATKKDSGESESQTKEKLIMMYWDLYSRLKAANAELSQYKLHYVTTFNLASREYTNIPSVRVLKVTASATTTSTTGTSTAGCTSCGPFLDITWRAANLPAVRLDLVSTGTRDTITLSTSTPNDGKETLQLNIPANQASGKYYLVISSAAGNLSTLGKSQKPILTLENGVATIAPYTLRPAFKLIQPVTPQDPADLRADADAKYKAEHPDKGGKNKNKKKEEKEEDEGCSIAGAMILGPGCHINNR